MKKRAFTVIELIVVLALLAVFFGLMVLYSEASQVRADLHSQVAGFVSYARLEQSAAASGKNGDSHGIHLESDSYSLFVGSSFNPSDFYSEVLLPPSLEIQNIQLQGGGVDLVFDPPFGRTDTYGTLDFYSETFNQSIPISISYLGTISY